MRGQSDQSVAPRDRFNAKPSKRCAAAFRMLADRELRLEKQAIESILVSAVMIGILVGAALSARSGRRSDTSLRRPLRFSA